MTTHELAGLFEHLRAGLGSGLRSDVAKGFGDAAQAFRELPNQPLKDFVKQLKPSGSLATGSGQLVERIRAARAGREPREPVAVLVRKMNGPGLKAVLEAIGVPAKRLVADNKSLILDWMAEGQTNGTADPDRNENADPASQAYRLYCDLQHDLPATIAELRSRFEPMRQFSKPILQEVGRKLGYHYEGTKDEILDRLRQALEGFLMNRVPSELVGVAG